MNVKNKLYLMLLSMIVCIFSVFGGFLYLINEDSKSTEGLVLDFVEKQELAKSISERALIIRNREIAYVAYEDEAKKEELLSQIKKDRDSLNSLVSEMQKRDLDKDSKLILDDYKDSFSKYSDYTNSVFDSARQGDSSALNSMVEGSFPFFSDSRDILLTFEDALTESISRVYDNHKKEAMRRVVFLSSVSSIFLIALIIFTKTIVSHITLSVEKIKDSIFALSSYDLRKAQQLAITSSDEFMEIDTSLNILRENLASYIGKIKETSYKTLEVADIVRNSICQNSSDIDDVSSTLEQVTQDSNELKQIIRDNLKELNLLSEAINISNDSIIETEKLSNEVGSELRFGFENVSNMESSVVSNTSMVKLLDSNMSQLESDSKNIMSVLNFIEDVSSRVNLLALNASIEAARAGDAGLGFSVVAGEIGELASSTDEATKEIKGLISSVVSEIEICKEVSSKIQNVSSEMTSSYYTVKDSFLSLEKRVDNISCNITNVSLEVDKITTMKDSFEKNMKKVGEVSDLTTDAIQSASDSIEEQNLNMTNVLDKANELNSVSSTLKMVSDKFIQ